MDEHLEKAPIVSVILPVYNGGEDLAAAIQSIINQTYTNWELILMDDGSTDGSLERMKEYKDPRIKLFSDGVNKGLSRRLNEAVSKTTGAYIARMDADDIAFPKRLEIQVKFLEANKEIETLKSKALKEIEKNKDESEEDLEEFRKKEIKKINEQIENMLSDNEMSIKKFKF